jgi:hypothetical protein
MTFEMWRQALVSGAKYLKLLDATWEDMGSPQREQILEEIMSICDYCGCTDLRHLAREIQAEADRLDVYARAALEGGSAGIRLHVMLPMSMTTGRSAFDESEGEAHPNPGTAVFIEAAPGGHRALVGAEDANGWSASIDLKGRSGAGAGRVGEDLTDPRRDQRDGGQLPPQQEPEDPGDLARGGKS